LPLAGFSFFGLPEIVEANGDLQGLVFLGNRSNNDDIFYYEPEKNVLTPLTETSFSEKSFTVMEKDGRLEIATRSLWAKYRYHFDPQLRKSALLEEEHFPARQKKDAATETPEYYNTYIGFGDSITAGWIEGVQRLDACYLAKMGEILAGTYGPSWSINLGIPATQTYQGAERVDEDLDRNPALYFLLMYGVNDIWRNTFSLDSSLENLRYIISAALSHGRRVIVSTLTPRKDRFSLYQYYWKNLRELSAGILDLAKEKNVASIGTLSAIMNTDPPDGWKTLLEDIIPGVSTGNHPNEKGHQLIASLFAPVLVSFPPLPPSGICVLNPEDPLKKNVQWDMNYESDFGHFAIEFAFVPDPLSQSITTVNNYFTFSLFPFLPRLYFRLQTVDRDDHASAFSAVFPAQSGSFSPAHPHQQRR